MNLRSATLLLSLTSAAITLAQCPFTPTIEPSAPILCPNESATLTTQVYDAYQWYKDGSLISGATAQTLTVEQFNDAGSTFTVAATLDNCTETSAAVLVDGWAFLFPYVIHGGDEPNSTGPNGDLVFCQGDTLTLTLGSGYTENIVWTNFGVPIPDESSPTLIITTSGLYTVSAAPDVCPNSIMGIGVDIGATFNAPIQPDIVLNGSQLCAYPVGTATQWYLSGVPIATTDCIDMDNSGPYTVFVDYGSDCQVLSEPYFSTGITTAPLQQFTVSPVPAQQWVRIDWASGQRPEGAWDLIDITGRSVLHGEFQSPDGMVMNVGTLRSGIYFLKPASSAFAPMRVVVSR